MDPRRNPFAPGAGTPPPHELFGRRDIIEDVDVAVDRLRLPLFADFMRRAMAEGGD